MAWRVWRLSACADSGPCQARSSPSSLSEETGSRRGSNRRVNGSICATLTIPTDFGLLNCAPDDVPPTRAWRTRERPRLVQGAAKAGRCRTCELSKRPVEVFRRSIADAQRYRFDLFVTHAAQGFDQPQRPLIPGNRHAELTPEFSREPDGSGVAISCERREWHQPSSFSGF